MDVDVTATPAAVVPYVLASGERSIAIVHNTGIANTGDGATFHLR